MKDSFFCPLFGNLVSEYDCTELHACVYNCRLNDGIPYLLSDEEVGMDSEYCYQCTRHEVIDFKPVPHKKSTVYFKDVDTGLLVRKRPLCNHTEVFNTKQCRWIEGQDDNIYDRECFLRHGNCSLLEIGIHEVEKEITNCDS